MRRVSMEYLYILREYRFKVSQFLWLREAIKESHPDNKGYEDMVKGYYRMGVRLNIDTTGGDREQILMLYPDNTTPFLRLMRSQKGKGEYNWWEAHSEK